MSYNIKRVIDMLENDFEKVINKGDITPSDLAMLKDASKTMYYLTAYCVMKEEPNEYSGKMRYGMPPHYYVDNMGRNYGDYAPQPSMNYSGNMRGGYSGHSMESKREFLEEMLREARTESEKEMLRQKLNELDRMR